MKFAPHESNCAQVRLRDNDNEISSICMQIRKMEKKKKTETEPGKYFKRKKEEKKKTENSADKIIFLLLE